MAQKTRNLDAFCWREIHACRLLQQLYGLLCHRFIPASFPDISFSILSFSLTLLLSHSPTLCVGFCKCLSPFVHFISFRNFLLNFRFINDCTFGAKWMVQRELFFTIFRIVDSVFSRSQNSLVFSQTYSGLRTQNCANDTAHTYTWFGHANERERERTCVCARVWLAKCLLNFKTELMKIALCA